MFNFEYHEGYYAVGNGIPFDKNQSKDWQEGWKDGYYSLYDDNYITSDECHIDFLQNK